MFQKSMSHVLKVPQGFNFHLERKKIKIDNFKSRETNQRPITTINVHHYFHSKESSVNNGNSHLWCATKHALSLII